MTKTGLQSAMLAIGGGVLAFAPLSATAAILSIVPVQCAEYQGGGDDKDRSTVRNARDRMERPGVCPIIGDVGYSQR
jgi:hypothetical protein